MTFLTVSPLTITDIRERLRMSHPSLAQEVFKIGPDGNEVLLLPGASVALVPEGQENFSTQTFRQSKIGRAQQ